MSTLIAFILIYFFLLLAGIHVYWTFGGKGKENSVLLTIQTEKRKQLCREYTYADGRIWAFILCIYYTSKCYWN